ncbi:hypothetical protein FK85_29475, partial [Halorubrum saccharovorum]
MGRQRAVGGDVREEPPRSDGRDPPPALTPDEQASVLSAAAAGVSPVSADTSVSADDPVSGAFDRLAGA